MHPEVPKTKLQPKIVSIELSIMSCSTPTDKSTESVQGLFKVDIDEEMFNGQDQVFDGFTL